MSARAILHAALFDALRDAPGLAEVTVFDAPPVRFAVPYAVIDEPVLGDWGTKDMAGREGRVSVTIHDSGERPVRLRALAGAAEDAVLARDGALEGGWRLVNCVLLRSRVVRAGEGRWLAVSEFRVRMLRG